MKLTLTFVCMVCLVFSFATVSSAEVLFGVSGEVGQADITASSLLTNISDSPTQWALTGNLNLLGTHIDLQYSMADMDQYSFSTVDFRVGWELGLDILKIKAFGGYQHYLFTDDALSANDHTYSSLVVGMGAASKFGKFTFYGSTLIPLKTRFENDAIEDDDADISMFQAGIAYAPLPLVDLFLNYRTLKAESDYLDLDSEGYTFGVKISF